MGAVASYFIQMILPAFAGGLLWGLTRPWRRYRLSQKGFQAGPYREGALLFLFLFLAGLFALTLTPAGFWSSLLRGEPPHVPPAFQGGINLIPFQQSYQLLCYYVRHGLWDAIWINFPGNILMFFPIGFLSGLLMDKPRWWKGTLITFFLSLFIETFQLLVSRGTDVDDVILNTLGGLGGYGMFLLLRRIDPNFIRQCTKLRKESA